MKVREDFAKRFQQSVRESNFPENRIELGRLFGTSGAMIQYYWTGKKLPSMPKAIEIATHLGLCVEWFLTGRGDKHPNQKDESLSPAAIKVAREWTRLPRTLRKEVSRMIENYPDRE